MNRLFASFGCCLILLCGRLSGGETAPRSEDVAFFETRIRPVLVKHCYECHAENSAELGGKLLLSSREGMRSGGESGPAVVAGKPDESLIIQALKYDGIEMPPEAPLPEAIINDFVSWVRQGAVDPRTITPVPEVKTPVNSSTEEQLWSLVPPTNPPLPKVGNANWPRDPLDHFILSRLESANLQPGGDASPAMLIRRLYYDIIGLPPTAADVEQFCAEFEQFGNVAVERFVDELLARPQYGERWGRHWLDVARYAESNGNDGLGRNPSYPHAWRYRDYVIESWNADLPYDQFLTEQIAGDLLPSQTPAEHDRHLVATGFLALTAKPAKAMNTNFAMDVVADQIDVVGRGILGLSIACARCHDHKFDPIPTRDYYALAGIFTSSETLWGAAGNEPLTAPATDLHVLTATPNRLPPADFVESVVRLDSNTGEPKPAPKSKWEPGTPLAMGVRERKQPADCKINIKGEADKLGEAVPRGFLSACESTSSSAFPIGPDSSGRLELAHWLTSKEQPLTARVMVNRIWLHLFGEGIVRTPDDFGVYGERPSHPELLDHLAHRFVQNNWSMKQLIRALVLSRTYQLSSNASPEEGNADPENRLLGRHLRRRLDAEALRDSMLQVSGGLNLQPGDGSLIRHRDILINLAGNLHQPSSHRSIYLCYLRSSPPPELAPFDLPEFTAVTGRRDISTVPGQALHLFNSPFVIHQAELLAQRLLEEKDNPPSRIQDAFRSVLGREPTLDERDQSLAVVTEIQRQTTSEVKAWASLCQALLMTSEFRYVD